MCDVAESSSEDVCFVAESGSEGVLLLNGNEDVCGVAESSSEDVCFVAESGSEEASSHSSKQNSAESAGEQEQEVNGHGQFLPLLPSVTHIWQH